LAVRAVRIAGSLGSRLWVAATRRPVDTTAVLAAVAASLIIVVNAVFLQSGAHPAPFFANPVPPPLSMAENRPLGAASPAAAIRINDPIADFIELSSRIMAVQRVLSEYGYGQIKPSGVLDDPTKAAIERFEREHTLPVTGEVSDRLVNGLAAMTGHPLQ
jgi:hypothetical protein